MNKSNQLFTSLGHTFDQYPDCVFIKDTALTIQYVNQTFLTEMKYKKKNDLIGKKAQDLWPEFANIYHQHDLDTLNDHTYYQLENGLTNEKEKVIGLINKTLIKNDKNQTIGILCFSHLFFDKEIYNFSNAVKNITGSSLKVSLIQDEKSNPLTQRESECLFYFLMGKSAKTIAALLKISNKTVEFHLHNIKIKWNCYNRACIFEKAYEYGYLNVIPPSLFNANLIFALKA